MTIIEGDLEFRFDAAWQVLKYDEPGSFYKTLMAQNVSPTKAMDFLCLCAHPPLLMLEVKDFSRSVPVREKFDKIPMIVALKARDTVDGIIGGSHRASSSQERNFFQTSYQRMSRPPRVIYFFEDLNTPVRRSPQRALNKRDVLLKQLREHLRWLTRDIAVVGLSDYHKYIRGLTIRQI